MTLRNIRSTTSCYLIPLPDQTEDFEKNIRTAPVSGGYLRPAAEEKTPLHQSVKTEASIWIRQARLAAETREFESEFARLRRQIEEKEPWPYSRFTDALEAGLNCMPRGATYEAMHAIAKRKVSMAKDILLKLEEFPERSVCIARERECRPARVHGEHDLGPGIHFGHSGDDFADTHAHFESSRGGNDCHDVCVSWHTTGRSLSSAELKSAAEKYCALPLEQDKTEKR